MKVLAFHFNRRREIFDGKTHSLLERARLPRR